MWLVLLVLKSYEHIHIHIQYIWENVSFITPPMRNLIEADNCYVHNKFGCIDSPIYTSHHFHPQCDVLQNSHGYQF